LFFRQIESAMSALMQAQGLELSPPLTADTSLGHIKVIACQRLILVC
jgi:hypothetical protein